MCPTYTFIDRANGRFNEAMDFKKDYAALLSAAWEIDTAYDQFLNNPDENSYETLANLGLAEHADDGAETRKELLRRLVKTPKSNKFRQRYIGDANAEDIPEL